MNYNTFCAYLFCGEKGVGKTSYVLDNWKKNLLFDGSNPLNNMDTFNIIRTALNLKGLQTNDFTADDLLVHLGKQMQSEDTIIIDEAELINENAMKLILNHAILNNNFKIVFLFDIHQSALIHCEIFKQLINWKVFSYDIPVKEYKASSDTLCKFINNNYITIEPSQYPLILELTNNNFNNINKLMWVKKILDDNSPLISKNIISEYVNIFLEEKFKELPSDILTTLKQSSIIGEVFHKQILEDVNGFNIFDVSNYIKKIEAMKIFIRKYLRYEGLYSFISQDIHYSIYSGITPKEKKDWINILINYYTTKVSEERNEKQIIKYISQIKFLQLVLNDTKAIFQINHKLLFYYQNIGDDEKLLEITNELISYAQKHSYHTYEQYFLVYKIELLCQTDRVEEALIIINKLINDPIFSGSRLTLKYYKARCLYNAGDVDVSYNETVNLVHYLERTSGSNENPQPLYSLVYSLMATIQNHFDIYDGGEHYYNLALNHALNHVIDKSVYYNILKKCDMFYTYPISVEMMKTSMDYYQKQNVPMELGQIYLNYATEILFQESSKGVIVKEYLNMAKDIFSHLPNERLAYVKNNLAIYYILEENNPTIALKELEESLFVDLSAFTYMTIYLNCCMCLILLNDIDSEHFFKTYESFNFYIEKILNREHATRYEIIYKELLDIVTKEHSKEIEWVLSRSKILLESINKDNDTFFKYILSDIIMRNSQESFSFSNRANKHFYNGINRKKIFLAEFRFWE